MPKPFDIARLDLDPASEAVRLLSRCPGARCVRFDDGEFLLREGDPGEEVFLVLRGSYVVAQSVPEDAGAGPGEALAVTVVEPDRPSFVGEMAYLGGGRRSASVRSSMASFVLRLAPGHLDVIIREFPLLTRTLCQQFTTRLKETNALLKDLTERLRMDTVQVMAKPGQVLFRAGDRADTLYQLVHGALCRTQDGREGMLRPADTVLGFVEPAPYFAGGVHTATVAAHGPAMLVSISADSREAVVRNYPGLLLRLYSERAGRP